MGSRIEPPLATSYCGVSYLAEGQLRAIGLNTELDEVWSYQLPAGQFNNQIEYVQSGRLRADDQGEWVVAAPDGSVHIISDDGNFSDTFALGELLTGLSTAKLGDDRVVLDPSNSPIRQPGALPIGAPTPVKKVEIVRVIDSPLAVGVAVLDAKRRRRRIPLHVATAITPA